MHFFTVRDIEHPSAEAAIAVVEARGSGSVIKWGSRPNPLAHLGALPERESYSLALWSYEDGVWYRHAMSDGIGGRLTDERPA